MRVLVIGSGGREAAIAWACRRHGHDVVVTPDLAPDASADLVIVGPETALAAGVADECKRRRLPCFGPTADVARLESSKGYAREIAAALGLPSPRHLATTSLNEAIAWWHTLGAPIVVKQDGLAAGKGVVVPATDEATVEAIEALTALGPIVLEERLSGPECSLMALCDGKVARPLPVAQDHKRVGEGDTGPNTGGMGAYAPAPTGHDADALTATFIQPVIDHLAAAGTPYVGVLYAGLMLTADGPRLIEFNCRFGDPETQVLLAQMDGDLLPLLEGDRLPQDEFEPFPDEDEEDEETLNKKPLKLAIVGRPNAGKSTLINAMLGEDRLLTGPEAGITRDSIAIEWDWTDPESKEVRPVRLIDTAGMRKKALVVDKLEKLAVADARHAVDFAEVVVLLLDATRGLEHQDLKIASMVIEEGRALIVAINKWDVAEDASGLFNGVKAALEDGLSQVKGLPVLTVSARTTKGLDTLIKTAFELRTAWSKRVPTALLNKWFDEALAKNPPPAPGGKRIKLRYMTQARNRPPTFVIFGNRTDELPASYARYLLNGIRRDLDFGAVPVRINFRSSKNPFADNS